MIDFKQVKKEINNFEKLFKLHENNPEKLLIVMQSFIEDEKRLVNFLELQCKMLNENLINRYMKEIQENK